jgi:hypothetical protein
VSGAWRHWLVICAGAIGGISLWAVNMQLGQILPYVECGSRIYPVLLISVAAAAVSLGCGWVSWRSPGRSLGRSPGRSLGRTEAAADTSRFVARVSALLGLVFTFALLLHAASALLLTGCER